MAVQNVMITRNADRPENGLEGLAQVCMYTYCIKIIYMIKTHDTPDLWESFVMRAGLQTWAPRILGRGS